MTERDVGAIVASTQAYYDGPADEIYRTIWGDNLHLGVPCSLECPHPEAMEHTNEIMANAVSLTPDMRVLDLGCGYGSTARYLAANFGCAVTGTNISERELELARSRATQAGLDHLLSFEYGDFHRLAYLDDSYDVVWSQEAFLHAVDKMQSFRNAGASSGPAAALSSRISWCAETLRKRTGRGYMTESNRPICGICKITGRHCPNWNCP